MKKVGWGLGVVLMAAAGALTLRSWAAEPAKMLHPTDLLPADSAIYLHVAGAKELHGAVEQSAAYHSLSQSGLIEFLGSLIEQGAALAVSDAGAPKESSAVLGLLGQAFSHAWDHGLYVGVDAKLLIGEASLVLPEAAATGLSAEIDKRIRSIADLTQTSLREETIEGRKVTTLRLDPFLLSWWNEGPHLAMVANLIGPGAPIRRAIGRDPSFTQSERARRFQMKHSYAVGGEIWLDMAAILRLFPRVEPVPKVIDYMGIESIQGIRFTWGYDGPILRTDVDLLLGKPRKGLLSTVDAPAVSIERLPRLPVDVENVLAFSLDGEYLYDKVRPAVIEGYRLFNPEQAEQAKEQIAQLDQILGLSLRDDLSKNLGPTAVLYSSAVDGPFGFGGLTLAVEVKNRQAIEGVLSKLALVVPIQVPGSSIEQTSFQGNDLWISTFKGSPIPLNPTVGLSSRWLIIGLASPSSVLRFLRLQSDSATAAWIAPKNFGVHADRPQAKLIAAQYSDPRPTVRTLTSLLPTMASLVRSNYPSVAIDWIKLPKVDQILAPLFPGVGTITVDEEGVHISHHSSLPLPSLGSDGGGLASAVILGSMAAPVYQSSRAESKLTTAKNNLRHIGFAVATHEGDTLSLPRGTVKEAAHLKENERLSWLAALLPYLDEESIFGALDFKQAWDGPTNQSITKKSIPRLQNAPTRSAANTTNFVGMSGVGPNAAALPADDPKAGVFGYDRETTLREIRDGSSKTIMAVGVEQKVGPWGQGGESTVRGLSQRPYYHGYDGFGGAPEGILVLMADGSVRVFDKNVDPRILEAMATKAGGETADPKP